MVLPHGSTLRATHVEGCAGYRSALSVTMSPLMVVWTLLTMRDWYASTLSRVVSQGDIHLGGPRW